MHILVPLIYIAAFTFIGFAVGHPLVGLGVGILIAIALESGRVVDDG